jgi:steroid 5-alpha reductase family enzyme
MTRTTRQSVLAILAVLAVGAAIAWAGSRGGATVLGLPLFALCALLSFAINWAAFLPAWSAQTERYYDLTGTLTYLTLVACALVLGGEPDARALLLGGLVCVWALRLGSFLFARIRREGSDRRFDALKPDFARFLLAWTLQGLWVFLTVSCALAAMTSLAKVPLGRWAALGAAVWLAGFAFEVVADRQKSRFRADPRHRDRFITSGLWAWSRHPNYFGEITLWVGVALVAAPALSGWQLATLVSPVFVFLLLTRVSGIPLLEARAQQKWGHDPEYRAYRARTPVLFPRPPVSA